MVSGSLHWGFSLMMSSMGVSHAKSFQEVASKPLWYSYSFRSIMLQRRIQHGLMRPSMGPLPRPDRFTGLALLEPGACALRQAPLMVMEAMEPGAYGACWTGPTTRARATRLGVSIATDDQPREWEVPRHWAKPKWLGNVGNSQKTKPAGKRELMGSFQVCFSRSFRLL